MLFFRLTLCSRYSSKTLHLSIYLHSLSDKYFTRKKNLLKTFRTWLEKLNHVEKCKIENFAIEKTQKRVCDKHVSIQNKKKYFKQYWVISIHSELRLKWMLNFKTFIIRINLFGNTFSNIKVSIKR